MSNAGHDGYDIFEDAKSNSLTAFLEMALGVAARKAGVQMRMDSCPACGASHIGSQKLRLTEDRKWFCYQCSNHGSIIDAAMRLYSDCRTPLDAARYVVTGDTRPAVSPEQIAQQRAHEDVRRKWAAWAVKRIHEASREQFDREVLRYLTGTRGLEPKIVQEAWRRGILAGLPSSREASTTWLRGVVGDDALRHAGLWKEDAAQPWIAGRPLLQFVDNRELAEFRIIYKPTDPQRKKTLSVGMPGTPFFWRGQDGSRCLVVEGCLEALAALSMGYAGSVMGTAGVGCWSIEWFKALARTGVSTFDLAFNNDRKPDDPRNPGQEAQADLARQLQALGLSTYDASPREAGDINDALLRRKSRR